MIKLLQVNPVSLGALSSFIPLLADTEAKRRRSAFAKLRKFGMLIHPDYVWSDLHYIHMTTHKTGLRVLQFVFIPGENVSGA